MAYYFIYGTNEPLKRLFYKIGVDIIEIQNATLKNYTMVYNRRNSSFPNQAMPNIINDGSGSVDGKVVKIYNKDIKAIESIEEYPSKTEKIQESITLNDGSIVQCFLFKSKNSNTFSLKGRSYLEHTNNAIQVKIQQYMTVQNITTDYPYTQSTSENLKYLNYFSDFVKNNLN